jgi:flagellar hook-length control protein FliK
MPNAIQNLVPVRRTVPTSPKPVESRSDDRREDFRQLLDEASNRPAERTEASAKSAKPESKNGPKKKAGGASGKSKAARKDGADVGAVDDAPEAEGAESGDAAVADLMTDAERPVDRDEDEVSGEARADGDADGKATTAQTDGRVRTVDAAALVQSAAAPAATTVDAEQAIESQEAGDGAEGAGVEAIAGDAGPAQSRVQAASAGNDANEEDGAGDEGTTDVEAALSDTAGAAAPEESAGDDSGGSDQSEGQPGAPAAPVAKKASGKATTASSVSTVSPLGGSRVGAAEVKAEKSGPAGRTVGPDVPDALAAVSQVAEWIGPPGSEEKAPTKGGLGADPVGGLTSDANAAGISGQATAPQAAAAPKAQGPALPPQPPEAQFADANHDSIVTGVKAQLLPHGGSMQIRLDPPELGALKVMVEMRDGTMTATFQTSNDEATQLLSHSLNQLKHVLEGQGVSVERLQVQQAPRADSQSAGDDAKQQQQQQSQNWQDEHAARQEQQRKEMLRRMWRRVSGVSDPIDVTA